MGEKAFFRFQIVANVPYVTLSTVHVLFVLTTSNQISGFMTFITQTTL